MLCENCKKGQILSSKSPELFVLLMIKRTTTREISRSDYEKWFSQLQKHKNVVSTILYIKDLCHKTLVQNTLFKLILNKSQTILRN